MNVYLCVWMFEKVQWGALDRVGKAERLTSYYHSQDKKSLAVLEGLMAEKKREISLFLDSGAFSAFTKKVEIDIAKYIEFVHTYKKALDVYAVLDDILDPQKTWDNQMEMERNGLEPLPCYHYGEPISWLKKYLDKYEYLAIGGMVPIPNAKLQPWLDQLFKGHLTDQKGRATTKIHGFGMTSIPLMRRYPWFSVDSTSWILSSRFGSIMIPSDHPGKADLKVCVSHKAGPSNLEKEGRHFSSLSKLEQDLVVNYVEKLGFTMKDAAEDYKKRDEINILFFRNLEAGWEPTPLGATQGTF